jgi:hypothetical protein
MPFIAGSGLNGPLKYKARSQFPFGVNSVGGNAAQKAKSAYLDGAPLEYVDDLPVLAYGTPDDNPRTIGYAWNGCSFPFSYATGVVMEGVTPTLTAASTVVATAGGGVNIVTSAGAPALNTYVSGTNFAVTAGKRMWYNIRFSLQTVASEAVIVGFVNSFGGADLTTLPTDGIFFLKTLAGTDFSAIVRKASTSTTVSSGALVAVGDAVLADTVIVDLGILVDFSSASGLITGQGAVSFYCNGKFVGQAASGDANMPTVALAYAIACNTTGGAKTMTVTQGAGITEV